MLKLDELMTRTAKGPELLDDELLEAVGGCSKTCGETCGDTCDTTEEEEEEEEIDP